MAPRIPCAALAALLLAGCGSSGGSGKRSTAAPATSGGSGAPTSGTLTPWSSVPRAVSAASFRTLDRGLVSGVQVAALSTRVVTDEATWSTLWATHRPDGSPAPQVDFTRERVVGLLQAPGGGGIELLRVEAAGAGALALVYEARPGTTGSDRPFHFVALADTASRLVFREPTSGAGGGALVIQPPGPLVFGVDAPYAAQAIRATGGAPPYQWLLASGALPPGLTFLAEAEAVVAGSPAQAGTFTLMLQVRDALGGSAVGSVTIEARPLQLVTVAGAAGVGFAGDGQEPAMARFQDPQGIAAAPGGAVLLADGANHRLRQLTWKPAGAVRTLAGLGSAGATGDGGAATSAQLSNPTDVAVDPNGYVYVADRANHRVRRIDPATGIMATWAGTGQAGFAGDGGLATAARLNNPSGLALTPTGDLLIADTSNHRLRKVDQVTGTITTVAGTGQNGFLGDGGAATAARLSSPRGLAVDRIGNVFVLDQGNARARRIDYASGAITTVAGTGQNGVAGDGGPATAAPLNQPRDLAVDAAGNLFLLEAARVRRVDAATGVIRTVAGNGASGLAGDGGPATAAALTAPRGLAIHPSGALLVTTGNGSSEARLRAITATPASPF